MPTLHRWFEQNARDLPWRRTNDPYAIWVSEVMLQQTQVVTVIPYFERWMKQLPTIEALAEIDETRLLRLWEGLGYYSRARNMQRAAREVVAKHDGQLPSERSALSALPGIGPYTAAAVSSIAFGKAEAVVDGNVRRVIGRLAAITDDTKTPEAARAVDALARQLLADHDPGTHNQAMMELGALVCTPRRPGCGDCPLQAVCQAAASGEPERFPAASPRAKVPHHDVDVAVLRQRGRILLQRRPYGGLLAGLWDLPAVRRAKETDGLVEALQRLGLRVELGKPLDPVKHAYTHLKVTLWPRRCKLVAGTSSRLSDRESCRWVPVSELESYPLPRAARKVLANLSKRSRL